MGRKVQINLHLKKLSFLKFYKHTIIAKTNQRNSQICKKYLYMDFKYKYDGPFLSKWFTNNLYACIHHQSVLPPSPEQSVP